MLVYISAWFAQPLENPGNPWKFISALENPGIVWMGPGKPWNLLVGCEILSIPKVLWSEILYISQIS